MFVIDQCLGNKYVIELTMFREQIPHGILSLHIIHLTNVCD